MKDQGKYSLDKLADAIRALAKAANEVGASISRLSPILERASLDLYRGNWWQRGEGEPEYLAGLQEPEWWLDGDGPPDWGCAA